MAETRMPHGDYKKVLFRVPADVLAYLEDKAEREVRSVNAEWVYLLRQLMKQDPSPRPPDPNRHRIRGEVIAGQ